MNSAVWKFRIAPSNVPVALDMPIGAVIVAFAEQHGHLHLWAIVNPEAAQLPRELWVIGTGWKADLGAWLHRFTCLSAGGAFVWHLFERQEPSLD